MAKKQNSKRQAVAKADYEIKPIVTTAADIAANSKLYAVLRLNESVEVTDFQGENHKVMVTNDEVAGYIPVFKTVDAAKKSACNGKYQIIAICPA
jgi:hypothetical protein